MSAPEDQFRDVIRAAGMSPPDNIVPGQFHRFPGAEKRNGNTAGWCKLFPDGVGGVFGDYSRDLAEQWQATGARSLTVSEREGFRQRVDQARAEADAARREEHAKARERATSIWNAAAAADDSHPYLARKGVKAHGLRLHKGALVIPLRDADGALHSLQFIGEDGTKRYLSGGRVSGCYCAMGTPGG